MDGEVGLLFGCVRHHDQKFVPTLTECQVRAAEDSSQYFGEVHQDLGQRVPGPDPAPRVTAADPGTCQIRRKPVLSGLINEYERAA